MHCWNRFRLQLTLEKLAICLHACAGKVFTVLTTDRVLHVMAIEKTCETLKSCENYYKLTTDCTLKLFGVSFC